MLQSCLRWMLVAPFTLVALTACGGEEQGQPAVDAPVLAPTADDAAKAVAESRSREPLRVPSRTNDQAPFACGVLEAQDVGAILGAETEMHDITDRRHALNVPVESSCLFAYGKDKNPDSIRINAKFVRVDVFTDRSLRQGGWNHLAGLWEHRTVGMKPPFALRPDALAAWVDSEHPPDPALIVRQGEVLYEFAYYPPSSSVGTPEGNAKIEEIARQFLTRLAEQEGEQP